MNCLVTGAAGFIGSHLCEQLLKQGHTVTGVDAFIPYYPRPIKEQNLLLAKQHSYFRFVSLDLRSDALESLVQDAEIVIHLAAMPGLVQSWTNFDGYWSCNVLATQRLLEAIRTTKAPLKRLIYGSTSSVYGKFASGDETLPTKPISPYGVTKLAGEHLCRAYGDAYGLAVVALRFFSVYGPRQRPDMAYNRFIHALLSNEPISVYGDGQQVRGNTFVLDCVDAILRSMNALVGETYNIGGGEMVSIWDILAKLEQISGQKFQVRQEAPRTGDQRHTFADTSKLTRHLGWQPKTSMEEGLRQQWQWQKSQQEQV